MSVELHVFEAEIDQLTTFYVISLIIHEISLVTYNMSLNIHDSH